MHRTTSITLLLTRLNCIEPHLKFRRATEAFDKTMLFITAVYESCPAVTLLMSATQATVTSTQVAVRYRRNVSSLSIDMSTNTRLIYRLRSVGQHIDQHIGRVSVEISADTSRSTYRPRVGRYVDRNIGRASVDMSTNISVEGCTNYTLSNVCMLPLSLLPYFLHAAR